MKLPPPHDETPTLDALRAMIRTLPADRQPDWGVMNAAQMLEHCASFHELCLGDAAVGRATRWLARAIGPFFLRRFLAKSPKATPRNLRTLDAIRAPSHVEFAAARERVLATLDAIEQAPDGHRHPLYGPMRAADLQALVRHHLAHHAHQFGLW